MFFAGWLFAGGCHSPVRPKESDREIDPSGQKSLTERLKAQDEINLPGVHMVWEDGLHVTGCFEKVKMRMGGSIMMDGGSIRADEELTSSF